MPTVSIDLFNAIRDQAPVGGLTHGFYKYPARFSPSFVRALIQEFSSPGDLVYDPFVGGGTTLVEARSLGRLAIGSDVSSLAVFVSRVKTTRLNCSDFLAIKLWAEEVVLQINLRIDHKRPESWIKEGYQTNINGKETWAIRKTIEILLLQLAKLKHERQRNFVRCAVLSTAQWALDCRYRVPTTDEFKTALMVTIGKMLEGVKVYSSAARANKIGRRFGRDGVVCTQRSVYTVDSYRLLKMNPPKLIVTSPPYPGTHVLYHRWQVQGRKETKAPFWIANEKDGQYAPYYCMGERRRAGNVDYFENLATAFGAIAEICDSDTLIAQMVAFPDQSWQLPLYLKVMQKVGFKEIKKGVGLSTDGRIWRDVPGRKFYAESNSYGTSNEVVLFHRLAR